MAFVGGFVHRRPREGPGPTTAHLYDYLSRKRNVDVVCQALTDIVLTEFSDCPLLVSTMRANFLLDEVARLSCRANGTHFEARWSWPTDNDRVWVDGFNKSRDRVRTAIIAFQIGDSFPKLAEPLIEELKDQQIAGIIAVRSLVEGSVLDLPVYSVFDGRQ